ncbi:Clavaminate synthase-like protein [Zopfia rhizophila CBS 207.26]|uniref:Clavaminate synthase-like protein n=1 Tax=Zopfia rhizophila CBS 207.26 TaxID=1314779 RepID=A0A6A6DQ00_9PEZI|nr:Clavaminate synthase-like protein [Zopfia rhizophila CBS 207.26]
MSTSFTSIPLVNFARLRNPETKDAELALLRDSVFNVGFLYLTHTGLEPMIEEAQTRLPDLFALSADEKLSVGMLNSPHFLGYTGLGSETTARQTDIREQFDFGTECKEWREQDPFWQRLEGPSQFPNAWVRDLVGRYTTAMSELGREFVHFVAESLSLPLDAFDQFPGEMSRLKFVKYPPAAPGSQGVGPHKDSIGLFTFLAQDSVGGLQVLNKSGEWIDATPVPGSLVVNVAQGFEAITGGVCSGTTHRVVAPTATTRYSIPFFQAVRLNLRLEELKRSTQEIIKKIPVSDDKKKRAVNVPSELISPLYECFGEAQLRNRIFSHPDVGQKWYPHLYQKYSLQVL